MFTEREQNQKRFSVERLNKPDIGTMAELYAEVFATPP